jgi:PPOX class probable F420-dependent enzyme
VHPDRGVDAVPAVFVLDGHRIVVPVDTVKPKRTVELARLENVRRDPRCVLLADRYSDDWTQLWWVRVHGEARVVEDPEPWLAVLAERYPQYATPGSVASVLVLTPTVLRGWAASDSDPR